MIFFFRDRRRFPFSHGNTRPFLSSCSSWHNWVLNIRSSMSSEGFFTFYHHIQRRLTQPSWLSRRDSYNPWECCCTYIKVSCGIEGRSYCICRSWGFFRWDQLTDQVKISFRDLILALSVVYKLVNHDLGYIGKRHSVQYLTLKSLRLYYYFLDIILQKWVLVYRRELYASMSQTKSKPVTRSFAPELCFLYWG